MESGNKWTKEEISDCLGFLSGCVFVIGILLYVFVV